MKFRAKCYMYMRMFRLSKKGEHGHVKSLRDLISQSAAEKATAECNSPAPFLHSHTEQFGTMDHSAPNKFISGK